MRFKAAENEGCWPDLQGCIILNAAAVDGPELLAGSPDLKEFPTEL
jgi:hypothetical protein